MDASQPDEGREPKRGHEGDSPVGDPPEQGIARAQVPDQEPGEQRADTGVPAGTWAGSSRLMVCTAGSSGVRRPPWEVLPSRRPIVHRPSADCEDDPEPGTPTSTSRKKGLAQGAAIRRHHQALPDYCDCACVSACTCACAFATPLAPPAPPAPPVAVEIAPPLIDRAAAPVWMTFVRDGLMTLAAAKLPVPTAIPAPKPETTAVTGACANPVATGVNCPRRSSKNTTAVGGVTPSPGLDTNATL